MSPSLFQGLVPNLMSPGKQGWRREKPLESHFSVMWGFFWGFCALSTAAEALWSQLGWKLPVKPQFSQYGEEGCGAFLHWGAAAQQSGFP